MLFRFCRRRLTTSAVTATAVESIGDGLKPPAPFVAIHEEGSCLFEAVGEAVTGEHVLCWGMLETRDVRRPNPGPLPCLWAAMITRGGFTMDVACSTVNTVLSVDGIAFYDSPKEAFEHSQEAHRHRRATYQGPLLHQGMLAALSTGCPHTFDRTVLPQRQAAANWYNAYQGTHTRWTRYDHLPVHTVAPELLDALVPYLQSLGIDDHLAAFMGSYREEVMAKETAAWRRLVKEVIAR